MPQITRKLEFDAGHRLLNHQGKCRHYHGHRYVAEITVEAKTLNHLGMVVDFSIVKEQIGGWIDKHLDHNMILHPSDAFLGDVMEHLLDRLPFTMPNNENPTAENIAKLIFQQGNALLDEYPISVTHVRLYETPNCWADYPEEGDDVT